MYALRQWSVRHARGLNAFYRGFESVLVALHPLWKRLVPNYVTTTENMGRAMLRVAKEGFPKQVLENQDINRIFGDPS